MTLGEFRALTAALPDEAEMLVNREFDYEGLCRSNCRLDHVLPAFTASFELDHMRSDITAFVNDGEQARPVLVLSDEPIKRLQRTAFWGDENGGRSEFVTLPPSPGEAK